MALMRFACSMSQSIDLRRPRKLTTEQSASVNTLPCIIKLVERVKKYSGARERSSREVEYWEAYKHLTSGKERQRRVLLDDIKDRFRNE